MDCDEARLLLSRRLDAVIEPAEAQALEMHVVSCATCRRLAYFLQAEQAALVDRWPAVAAPHGFAEQVLAVLPTRPMPSSGDRATSAAAAALACRRGRAARAAARWQCHFIAQPDAWASLGLFLRRVVLHETASTEPTRDFPVGQVTLDQAQQLVPWHIVQPTDLPAGYRLVAVEADELHAFAVGPTIVLHYQRAEGARAQEVSPDDAVALLAEAISSRRVVILGEEHP